jgi:GNAT superfamily N-acetyltransferase
VGGDWHWTDRLGWTRDEWLVYLDRPELETWIGYQEGTPAGYFEMERQPESQVELKYFGLLPQFIGRGLGGALLTAAVARAWRWGRRGFGSTPTRWTAPRPSRTIRRGDSGSSRRKAGPQLSDSRRPSPIKGALCGGRSKQINRGHKR